MKPTLEILENRYMLSALDGQAVFPDEPINPATDCPDLPPDLCQPGDYGSDSVDGASGNDSIPGGLT